MSSKIDKLNKLIDDQQAILDSVKAEARSISADDVYRENEELKSKIALKSHSTIQRRHFSARRQMKNCLRFLRFKIVLKKCITKKSWA